MILKAYALYAIRSLLGMVSGGSGAGAGVGAALAAGGGQFTNMAGGGMSFTSGPVDLPDFRVRAGEAQRELLTVMARPTKRTINGIPAQVGLVGSQNMAITSADGLANAAGGEMTLRVLLSPDLKAEIISSSVKRARVEIVSAMGQDSDVSRATRKLNS